MAYLNENEQLFELSRKVDKLVESGLLGHSAAYSLLMLQFKGHPDWVQANDPVAPAPLPVAVEPPTF